ncbi:unnamed protein product, partial [Symbiodinium necroappetens]
MSASGLTPVMEAAAAPATPTGAVGSPATPGVSLDFGPTSAPTTTAPGGLDLDSLEGLEPTPLGASGSSGAGCYGAEVVDLLGLELDDSPAHFIRSFVAGLSVTGLAAAIRALSPEDASNLRAAMAEAEATPDQDTAADE